ncbi:MAG TPA: hypothetical protein VG013_23845 [Gemmataceae bacterium]|jgi:HEAT repeat protein|nr:hypothetical protein [Gemmataceae bacterium]
MNEAMQPEAPPPADYEPSKGLPPVEPPSGKMLAQFFLVPLLIVAVVGSIVAVVVWLSGSRSSPEYYLRRLDDPDPDVRWRAANDLGSDLAKSDRLASDPKFALDIADRLRQALDASAAADKAAPAQPKNQAEGAAKTLEAQRTFIVYLTASLGNFMVPVGLPLLEEMAVHDDSGDTRVMTLRRRGAVWALANLGENLQRFDKLPADQQEAVLAELGQEAGGHLGERSRWAEVGLKVLKGRRTGHPQAPGVADALARCAEDPYPFVRQTAALAMSYWEGNNEDNARMEKALVTLLKDDGHGTAEEKKLLEEKDQPPAQEDSDPATQAWEIRYQAAVALARRGSDQVPLPMLHDMLDEAQLLKTMHRKLKDGKEEANTADAHATLINTLRAVVVLHQKGRDVSSLYTAIEQLSQNSTSVDVRTEADKTLIALGRK